MSGIRSPSLRSILVTELEVGTLSNRGLVNAIEELDEEKVKVEFFWVSTDQKEWYHGCWLTLDKRETVTVLPKEKWNSLERESIGRWQATKQTKEGEE